MIRIVGKRGGDLLVYMEGIDKSYPGVKALDGVNFELRWGEVHVLLGANGAGKSTLIKILSGVERSDSGQIYIEGERARIQTPRDAREYGIFTIYQQLTLIPQLTVAENICLGMSPTSRGLVDWDKMREIAQDIIDRIESPLNINAQVSDLTTSEKQLTEIAKALARKGKVLILDEPTSALSEDETAHLFDRIRWLRKEGVGIIYISHRLDEVAQIGDRATVIKDGQFIGTVKVAETSADSLVTMISGKEIKETYPIRQVERGKRILKAENLSHPKGKFSNISFELYEGEVLGMAGLIGSGRKEFIRALLGLDKDCLLEVELFGSTRKIRSPAEAIDAGIFYLPADRHREGLVLPLSTADNITLTSLKKYAVSGFLSLKEQDNASHQFIDKLNIKVLSPKSLVRYLSGGNQQKVMVARALCSESKVFIFDEPTTGIDIGTKVEIYMLINELAKQGAGTIAISPELPEIIGTSDRILAWRDGKVVGTLNASEAREETLFHLISRTTNSHAS
ncbi:MAG: D-xylose ABC transporter ATP-binding protein [Dehalococcoidales bacterium]|nr:D-xylose ABC transporter ATP-binding protein [Dehalococcoidales bacterium]